MANSGESPECRCKVFRKSPHFFKPLQVIVSIAIIICTIPISYGWTEPLWQTALACFLISGAATIAFILQIQHKLVKRYTCGKLTWNAVEFIYSAILAFYCGWNTVDSFLRGSNGYYYYSVQYLICGALFLILTITYLVSVVYIAKEELQILMKKQAAPMPEPENLVNKTDDFERFI